MFWQEDGIDLEGLRQRFESEWRQGQAGYYSQSELEELWEWYIEHEALSQARALLAHAEHLYPEWPRLSYWRSVLAYCEGKSWTAYTWGLRAFEENPPTPSLCRHLVETCLSVGRTVEAERFWRTWWASSPTPKAKAESAIFLAGSYYWHRRPEKALPFLWKAWRVYPPYRLKLTAKIAALYHQTGRLTEGLAAYWRCLWTNPHQIPAWLGLAQLYLHKLSYSQLEQALEQVQRLLAKKPEWTRAWALYYRLQAQAYEAQGKFAEAFQAWLQAREYEPSHPLTLLHLVRHYQRLGEVEAAEPYVRRLYQVGLHLPEVRQLIADLHWSAHRMEEALLYYRTLLRSPAHRTHALSRLIQGSFQLGKTRDLFHFLRYAAKRFSEEGGPWLQWIQEAYEKGALPLAYLLSTYALRAQSRRPTSRLYYWHAALALRYNRVPRALRSLELALLADAAEVGLFYRLTADLPQLPRPIQALLRRYT
ncbi:MAG: hypothetical protein ABDH91_00215 [Bacteroidia bacterium]